MTNLERLKKLIPSSSGYTDDELTAILSENNDSVYQAASEVIRGLCSQALSGAFVFWSGEVKIDKSKIIDNYMKLAEKYEEKASSAPSSQDELWGQDLDRLSGLDTTEYSDEDTEDDTNY